MPSYRWYKKRYYKQRTNKNYRNGKFTRYNTYRYRSAKSQATQIYNLSKRISKIENTTKPELLEYMPTAYSQPITTQTNKNNWDVMDVFHVTDRTAGFGTVIKEDSARIYRIKIWGILQREIGASPPTNNYAFDRDSSVYIRLAIFQYQAAKATDVDTRSIFDTTAGPKDFKAPLKKGCLDHGRIIKVINLKMDNYDPTNKTFKYSFRLKQRIVRKIADQAEECLKNGVAVLPVGLRVANSSNDASQYFLNMGSTVLYYDA